MNREPRSLEDLLHADVRVDVAPRPGDEARLSRIVGGTMAATGTAAAAWLGLRALLSGKAVAISIATATVTAAAAWALARPDGLPARAVTQPQPARASDAEGERAAPSVAQLPVVPAAAPPPDDRPPPLEDVSASRRPLRPTASVPAIDAAALLERAAAARRDGRIDAAIADYTAIGERFAGSREDDVGCVALGRLQLVREAAAALATFDRCLRDHPRGALVEQAMIGRADALRALGRVDEASAASAAVLERFPDSLHRAR